MSWLSSNWRACHFSRGLLTVPAWVRLWFFKPSRGVSEGNPLEDVHVTSKSNTDVLPLYPTSFCAHHAELHKLDAKTGKMLQAID